MKTISGKTISSKSVSLSKAAKILLKFVSAENGASQAISAYLHQTSAAFNELNQLHKELKSSRSGQKRKRPRSETYYGSETVVENPIQTIDISEELNHGALQSKNKFKGHQFGSEHVANGIEKQINNVVSHEPNDAVGYHLGNEGSGEKHKKKKKKQEIESRVDRDNRFEIEEKEGRLPMKTQNMDEGKPTQSFEFSEEPNDAVGYHPGNEGSCKRHKKKQEIESREHWDNRFEIDEKEGKLPMKTQNMDEGNPTQSFEFSEEPNDAVGYHPGNVGSGEKHKKKKTKQEIESSQHRDNRFEEKEGKLPMKNQNMDEGKPTQSFEFSEEPNDSVGVGGTEKHKKKKKKQEVDSRELGDSGIQIGERRDESKLTTKAQGIFAQRGAGDNLGMEGGEKHKRNNNKDRPDRVENGGSIEPQELQSRKKKTYKGGHEDKINTEEVKKEQRKKRKNEYVEERVEDRSGELTNKKMKRSLDSAT